MSSFIHLRLTANGPRHTQNTRLQVPGFPECHGLSCHTAELPFVFNNLDVIKKQYAMTSESRNATSAKEFVSNLVWGLFFQVDTDERLASMMADFWVAFGKTGNPNYKGAAVHWRQWKGRRRYHLQQNPVDDDDDEESDEAGGVEAGDEEGEGKRRRGRRGQRGQQPQQQDKGRKSKGKKGASASNIEPHYLDLKWKPEVHLATRDCTCSFWDQLGYRW